jgi:hypothetical protein
LGRIADSLRADVSCVGNVLSELRCEKPDDHCALVSRSLLKPAKHELRDVPAFFRHPVLDDPLRVILRECD